MEQYAYILNAVTYLLAASVLFFLGKMAFRIVNPGVKIYHELLEKDNVAFALSLTGYFIGLIAAIGGAIVGPSQGMLMDLQNIFSYGILGIVLLNASAFINDKVILRHFKLRKEIVEDQNPGSGVVELANYLATGLIIYGSIIGEGGGFITAILTWAIAQVLFIVATRVYNYITPYNIHDEIERDNLAVGIGYAGAMIGFANILRFAIQTEFDNWSDHMLTIGIDALLGFLLLPLMRFITDKLLLPGNNLTDEMVNQEHPNVGAAIIEAFAYIAGSILICWTL